MLSTAEKRNMLLERNWLAPDLLQAIRPKVLHILCRVPISRQTVSVAHTLQVPHRRFSLSSLSTRPHPRQSHLLHQLSQPITQCQCRPLLLYLNFTQARPRPRHPSSLWSLCSQWWSSIFSYELFAHLVSATLLGFTLHENSERARSSKFWSQY